MKTIASWRPSRNDYFARTSRKYLFALTSLICSKMIIAPNKERPLRTRASRAHVLMNSLMFRSLP